MKGAWKEFLSSVEQTKRKLLAITEGSLNFTLFCPTTESYKQLQQETWRNQLLERLKHLISEIGNWNRSTAYLFWNYSECSNVVFPEFREWSVFYFPINQQKLKEVMFSDVSVSHSVQHPPDMTGHLPHSVSKRAVHILLECFVVNVTEMDRNVLNLFIQHWVLFFSSVTVVFDKGQQLD